ncbi:MULTISPECIES: S8 family serine peptidase [unclassified Ruegeria]|uniref:S8 family serine peptidase n=1 Tax=unclassified Ruegeria TaxID=2625375 RepID=UPI001489E4A3|nr:MULTISPECIES: S8 family serine peptidase [unclassified Ruegeria]
MRIFMLLLLLAFPIAAQADDFRIIATGCVKPRDSIRIEARDFGARPSDILATSRGQTLKMQVLRWLPSQVTIAVPSRGLRAGETYRLVWAIRGTTGRDLGSITLCAQRQRNTERAARDMVPAPDGSPEYTVLVPARQEQAARDVLQERGAQLLRRRNLPQMGRVILFYAFPQGLTLADARAALTIPSPDADVDRHHIYGFAAPPRLYAAAMVGDPPEQSCALRRAVRVGVIDGPVQAGHPALAGVRIQRQSVLSLGLRPTGTDHATAVVGLIAGNGSGGIVGLAPGSEIFAAEAFGRDKGREGARLEDIATGLDWLRARNVQLVNMSMSGAPNAVFAELLARARARGMVVVAAAGNDSSNAPRLPAASPDTIAVTAVDAARRIYGKANKGPHIEFSAPGVDLWVITAIGGGYRSGTSYAAPLVTALLARHASRGGLSLDKARRILRQTAVDLGSSGRDTRFGYGLVQSGGC